MDTTARAVLSPLLVLVTLYHVTVGLGYPSGCGDRAPPSDDPVSGRRQTVAFLLTGGIPSSQPGLLGFRSTVTNVNSRVRPEYGSFIAETPGLYQFTFTAVSDNNSHFRIALRRNRRTVVTAFAERLGYQSASHTVLIELGADDIVYLQVEEGCIFESNTPEQTYTSFSGLLVAPSAATPGEGERGPAPGPALQPAGPDGTVFVAAPPGVSGGGPPLGGFLWPSAAGALPPGMSRPQLIPGDGQLDVLPPSRPGPQVTYGSVPPPGVIPPLVVPVTGGQVTLSAVSLRPELVSGAEGQQVSPAEAGAEAGSGGGGSRAPAVRRLIPRPPHTDISDLDERAAEQSMRFPDNDVSSGPACCDG